MNTTYAFAPVKINRAGDPLPSLTMFCDRCDRPFKTQTIRPLCYPCDHAQAVMR